MYLLVIFYSRQFQYTQLFAFVGFDLAFEGTTGGWLGRPVIFFQNYSSSDNQPTRLPRRGRVMVGVREQQKGAWAWG
jgi:hypothetical protein